MRAGMGKVLAMVSTLSLWCASVRAGESNAPLLDVLDATRFIDAVSAAQRVVNLPVEAGAEARSEALRQMDRVTPKMNEPGGAVCAYVRNCSLLQAGRSAEAQVGFAQLSGISSVAPEAVLGLVEANPMPPARRISFERCLADLLPISIWRWMCDAAESGSYADINPSRPYMPLGDSKKLVQIARLFETRSLHDFAWHAYVEAIYGGRAPAWSSGTPKEEAWFSPDTAELWARAADNAWKAGERAVAYDYLAKSVIFGPDGQLEVAKTMLAAWKASVGAKQEEIRKAQLQEAVEQIVTLYVEMNVHPRALEIIRTHPDWVKNPVELEARIADEWKAVLQAYNRAIKRVVVYGVDLTDKTDPTDIKVPFACSPEAVKRAAQEVKRLLDTERAVPKPDL